MEPNWRVFKLLGEGMEIIINLMPLKYWIALLVGLGLFVALFVPVIVRSL